jgi:hypothetical protein
MVGIAIVMFVVALLMFISNQPVIGGACMALGASILAINASLKKSDNG